jgi:hypothetical protein
MRIVTDLSALDDLPRAAVQVQEEQGLDLQRLTASLPSVRDALTHMLAGFRGVPVESATPEERAMLVDLWYLLRDLEQPLRLRRDAIEAAWKRGFAEMEARAVALPDGRVVQLEPPEKKYATQPDQMRAELLALKREGLITDDDLARAFTTTVTTTADHRVLNGLAKSRGPKVAAIIEKHREALAPSALAGRVRMPPPKED